MKTCKRCFRKFDEENVLDTTPATELADYLDSCCHGNDKEDSGNGGGETDIGVEDINDLYPKCKEDPGVMNLLGFGE